jgi:putative ABC transport system permease protein
MLTLKYYGDVGANTSRPIGESIGTCSPAIESYTVTWSMGNANVKTLEREGIMKECITPVTFVSPSFIEVFSLDVLSGNVKQFEEPKTAVISQSLAEVLFPNDEPVGNMIVYPNWKDTLQIVAVYKNLQNNCTFKNNLFINISDRYIDDQSEWSFIYFYKLNSFNAKKEIEEQAKKVVMDLYLGQEYIDQENIDEFNEMLSFHLEPFSNLYYSKVHYFQTGNKALTGMLVSIALIIILIAISNYINFFMALVPIRIRSVNINKVFGTPTSALRWNITGEAVGILLLSFGLALLLVEYLSGTFIGDLIDTSLKINDNLLSVLIVGIVIIGIGILVGLFPAFYITKFNPALVLKGSFGRSKQGQRLRSILIIFQFTISIALIIGAGFVHIQSRYMQKFDYGFNRDRLITVSVGGKIASQPQAFLSELRKNPAIEGIAYGDNSIVNIGMGWGRTFKGEHISHKCLPVSWNYPQFMGLTLIEGRFFIEDDATKIGGTIIFNETAAKKYNIQVGDFMGGHSEKEEAEVVGIVKDFNFSSLKEGIEPLALYEFGCEGWRIPSIANIRLSPNADFKQTTDFIASCMKEVNPDLNIEKIKIYPFDTEIENLYTKEQKLTKIISLFSLVAIIISLMGVFGIVVFENQHRRKEIALRKIHGSTATLILGMFNRKFINILLISFVIAAPIAYFAVLKWLSGFAYRTPVYWWVFAIGFLVVAFITLLTVTLQTYHSANENPIKAIKTE